MTNQIKDQATPKLWIIKNRTVVELSGKKLQNFQIETENGNVIALLGTNQEPNARLIVKAVNCHDELVEALKDCLKYIYASEAYNGKNHTAKSWREEINRLEKDVSEMTVAHDASDIGVSVNLEKAKQALAKAQEGI